MLFQNEIKNIQCFNLQSSDQVHSSLFCHSEFNLYNYWFGTKRSIVKSSVGAKWRRWLSSPQKHPVAISSAGNESPSSSLTDCWQVLCRRQPSLLQGHDNIGWKGILCGSFFCFPSLTFFPLLFSNHFWRWE